MTAATVTATTTQVERRPKKLGLLANLRFMLRFSRNPATAYARLHQEHGDTVEVTDLRGRRWFFVGHPDDVQRVHRTNQRNYRRGELNKPFADLLGDGLLTAESDAWVRHRRVLAPFFHGEYRMNFVSTVHHEVDGMLAALHGEGPSQPVDLGEWFERLTFRIITRGMFGFDWDDIEHELLDALKGALDYASKESFRVVPQPGPLGRRSEARFRRDLNTLDNAIDREIERRSAGQHAETPDLLDAMVTAELSHKEIRDEVLTMLHAGQNTVASCLSFTVQLIATHPEVEERVRRELAEQGASVPSDDPDRVPFLVATIKEAMRLYPPAWGGIREAREADQLGGGEIEPDTAVVFSQFVTHRHPDFWDDPDIFDPTRFENGDAEEPHPYAFFPFGGGPHLCIGHQLALIETAAVLARLLAEFDVAASTREIAFETLLDLVPAHGPKLYVTPKEVLAP